MLELQASQLQVFHRLPELTRALCGLPEGSCQLNCSRHQHMRGAALVLLYCLLQPLQDLCMSVCMRICQVVCMGICTSLGICLAWRVSIQISCQSDTLNGCMGTSSRLPCHITFHLTAACGCLLPLIGCSHSARASTTPQG